MHFKYVNKLPYTGKLAMYTLRFVDTRSFTFAEFYVFRGYLVSRHLPAEVAFVVMDGAGSSQDMTHTYILNH